jgi:hypothetical protein
MRPLLAIVIVFSILGGLQGYLSSRPKPEAWTILEEQKAVGQFEIMVTLTFDAGPDPFSFNASDAPSLEVQFRGESILKKTEELPAGTIAQAQVTGIVAGENEFYIQATPKDSSVAVARAIRVQILKDDTLVAEKSFWSEPGEIIGGVVSLTISNETVKEEHSHDSKS